MLNTLDSRALRRADCYGQRFMKEGDYPYNIVPAHGYLISTERPFVLRVRPRADNTGMKQHPLQIMSSAGKYTVSNPELVIETGDMVVWNSTSSSAHPCAVVGERDFFSSQRLVSECGFSHAFGTAGQYRWIDAHGSGVSGVVNVRDPECKTDADYKRWRQALAKGTVVMISDGKAEPNQVDILTCQTVFFAVVKGRGITITDTRVLDTVGPGVTADKSSQRLPKRRR